MICHKILLVNGHWWIVDNGGQWTMVDYERWWTMVNGGQEKFDLFGSVHLLPCDKVPGHVYTLQVS